VKKFLNLNHQELFRSMRTKLSENQRFNINTIGLIYVISGSEELHALLSPVFHPEDGLELERARSMCEGAENEEIRILGMIALGIYANLNVTVNDLIMIKNDEHFDLLIEAIQIKRRGGIDTEGYTPGNTGTILF